MLINSAELRFLNTSEHWYICNLNRDNFSKDDLDRIKSADIWMHEHCEPGHAFRFGGKFYFLQEQDFIQFKLTWE